MIHEPKEGWAEVIARAYAILGVFVHSQMTAALRRRAHEEDIVNDVWEVAIRKQKSFRYEGLESLTRWLFAIARLRLKELARGRTPAPETSLIPSGSTGDGGGLFAAMQAHSRSPSSTARKREWEIAVRLAVDELAGHEGEAVFMIVYEGLSFEQAAARAEVSKSTMERRLNAALAKLRLRLRGFSP